MKKLSIKVLMMVLLATTVSFTACTNNSNKTEKVSKDGKEYNSKYICPMHCAGSGGDEMGQCPVCGMDYIENKDHKKTDEHEGHNH